MIFKTSLEAKEYSKNNPSETVELKSYWSDGQLYNNYFYVNGLRHGEYKTYLDDGQLLCHCFYVYGEVFNLDYLKDSSYKSLCIKHTLFNGNVIDEDI